MDIASQVSIPRRGTSLNRETAAAVVEGATSIVSGRRARNECSNRERRGRNRPRQERLQLSESSTYLPSARSSSCSGRSSRSGRSRGSSNRRRSDYNLTNNRSNSSTHSRSTDREEVGDQSANRRSSSTSASASTTRSSSNSSIGSNSIREGRSAPHMNSNSNGVISNVNTSDERARQAELQPEERRKQTYFRTPQNHRPLSPAYRHFELSTYVHKRRVCAHWRLTQFLDIWLLAKKKFLRPPEEDQYIDSPVFGDEKVGIWFLRLYPYGDAKNAGALELYLMVDCQLKEDLIVHYKLQILKRDPPPALSHAAGVPVTNTTGGSGIIATRLTDADADTAITATNTGTGSNNATGRRRLSQKRSNLIQYEDSDLYAKNEPGVGYGPTKLCEVSTRKKVKALLWPDGCLRIRVLMDCPLLSAVAGPQVGKYHAQLLQNSVLNRSIVANSSATVSSSSFISASSSFSSLHSSNYSNVNSADSNTGDLVVPAAAPRATNEVPERELHAETAAAVAAEAAAVARGRRNAIDASSATFSLLCTSSLATNLLAHRDSHAPASLTPVGSSAAARVSSPSLVTHICTYDDSNREWFSSNANYSSASNQYIPNGKGKSLMEEVAAFVRLQSHDCDIIFDGEVYTANCLLLISRSKVFAAMLKGSFQEGLQQQAPSPLLPDSERMRHHSQGSTSSVSLSNNQSPFPSCKQSQQQHQQQQQQQQQQQEQEQSNLLSARQQHQQQQSRQQQQHQQQQSGVLSDGQQQQPQQHISAQQHQPFPLEKRAPQHPKGRTRLVLHLSDAAGVTKRALKNLLQFIHTDDCALFSDTPRFTDAAACALSETPPSSTGPNSAACSSRPLSEFSNPSVSMRTATEGQRGETRRTAVNMDPGKKGREQEDADSVKYLLELLIAADLYDVKSAYDRCIEEVVARLSAKNFSSVLLCATRISCKPLIKAARQFANCLSGGTVAAKMLQLLEAVWTAAAASLPPTATDSPPSEACYPTASAALAPLPAGAVRSFLSGCNAAAAELPSFEGGIAASDLASPSPSLCAADDSHSSAGVATGPAGSAAANTVAATPLTATAVPLTAAACSPRACTDAKRRRLNTTVDDRNIKRGFSHASNCSTYSDGCCDATSSAASSTGSSNNSYTVLETNNNAEDLTCNDNNTHLDSNSNSTIYSSSSNSVEDANKASIRMTNESSKTTQSNMHDKPTPNNVTTTDIGGKVTGKILVDVDEQSCCCSDKEEVHDQGVALCRVNCHTAGNTAARSTCKNGNMYATCALTRDDCSVGTERSSGCLSSGPEKQPKVLPCCKRRAFDSSTKFDGCLSGSLTSSHPDCRGCTTRRDSTASPSAVCRVNAKTLGTDTVDGRKNQGRSTATCCGSDNADMMIDSANSTSTSTATITCACCCTRDDGLRTDQQQDVTTGCQTPGLLKVAAGAVSEAQPDLSRLIAAALVQHSDETHEKESMVRIASDTNDVLSVTSPSTEKGEDAKMATRGVVRDEMGARTRHEHGKARQGEAGTKWAAALKESQRKEGLPTDPVTAAYYGGQGDTCDASGEATVALAQAKDALQAGVDTFGGSEAGTPPTKTPHCPIACPSVRMSVVHNTMPKIADGAPVIWPAGYTARAARGTEEDSSATSTNQRTTAIRAVHSAVDGVRVDADADKNRSEVADLAPAESAAAHAKSTDTYANAEYAEKRGRTLGSRTLEAPAGESTSGKAATSAGATSITCATHGNQQDRHLCVGQSRSFKKKGPETSLRSAAEQNTCSCEGVACACQNSDLPSHAKDVAPAARTASSFSTAQVTSTNCVQPAANSRDRSNASCDLHKSVRGDEQHTGAGKRAAQRKRALQLLHLSLAEATAEEDDEDCDW